MPLSLFRADTSTLAEKAALLRAYSTLPVFALCIVLAAAAVFFALRSFHRAAGRSARHDTSPPYAWTTGLLIVTVVFIIANHLLVRGIGVGIWDADGQFFPYYVFVADHVRAGKLVSWDPFSNVGLPLFGDPQVGAFSPITCLLGAIAGGTSRGFIAYWLLMWWAGGLGLIMLARHMKAPVWGGCTVCLGFLFSALYTGNAEHTPWLTSFSFLPLIIWRLDAALLSRRLWPSIESGALWGVSSLAGYSTQERMREVKTGRHVHPERLLLWPVGVRPSTLPRRWRVHYRT